MPLHRAILALLAAPLALAPSLAGAQPEGAVALRPIDRATVRIVSVRGLGISAAPGRRTRTRRVTADPHTSHGSGVAIEPQLVLTARHVVWGAEAWVVFSPGSTTPIAARPVYVDTDNDVAFIQLDRPIEHSLALPEARQLTLSERVSVSGYPLDLREPIPAAASGEVSRVTRNGDLHLTIAVNPGHSGGPVIDGEGRLVGMLSARGRPEAGVEGLAIAVTMQNLRAAHARIPPQRHTFAEADRDLARAIALLTGIEERALLDQLAEISALLVRAAGWTGGDADRDVILAALGWNALMELLEARGARAIGQLPEADRGAGTALHGAAQRLAERALSLGPHIRRRFPVVRAIALGHVDVEAQRQPPFR